MKNLKSTGSLGRDVIIIIQYQAIGCTSQNIGPKNLGPAKRLKGTFKEFKDLKMSRDLLTRTGYSDL